MKKCKNAKRYRAIKRPRCNNGTPCQSCAEKWRITVATLGAAIETEPVEDGITHPTEQVIAEAMAGNDAEGFVSAVLEITPNSLHTTPGTVLSTEALSPR